MWTAAVLLALAATPDGGQRVSRATGPGALDAGRLEDRAGFSRDESSFAFAAYSDPAGLHLFIVLDTKSGEMKGRVPLADDASRSEAEAIWKEGGYSAAKGPAPLVKLRVEGGRREALFAGRWRPLTDPLRGAFGKGDTARAWTFSPSGTRLAVELVHDAGGEFGKARTFAFALAEDAKAKDSTRP